MKEEIKPKKRGGAKRITFRRSVIVKSKGIEVPAKSYIRTFRIKRKRIMDGPRLKTFLELFT